MNLNSKISLSVNSETEFLKSVILGIPNDIGSIPKVEECFDPSSIYHVENNSYPIAIDISNEMTDFLEVLNKYNVKVLRPEVQETTAAGAAFMAGLKIGVFKSLKDISKKWHLNKEFSPKMKNTKRSELIKGWSKAIERTLIN